jgi:hypothetical protein
MKPLGRVRIRDMPRNRATDQRAAGTLCFIGGIVWTEDAPQPSAPLGPGGRLVSQGRLAVFGRRGKAGTHVHAGLNIQQTPRGKEEGPHRGGGGPSIVSLRLNRRAS